VLRLQHREQVKDVGFGPFEGQLRIIPEPEFGSQRSIGHIGLTADLDALDLVPLKPNDRCEPIVTFAVRNYKHFNLAAI